MNLSFTIVGGGALGGFYGVKLAAAGQSVRFLLRSNYEQARREGLALQTADETIRINPAEVYSNAAQMPPCDVLCVCTKSVGNARLPEVLGPLLRPGAALLCMQNGLGVEEDLARILPDTPLIGGLCYLGAVSTSPVTVRHVGYGHLSLGAHGPSARAWLEPVAAAFRAAGLGVQIAPNLYEARWRKLVWNIPFNGLCARHGLDTTELMAHHAAEVEPLLLEVCAAARACGAPVEDDYAAKMLEITRGLPHYEPSLKVDFDLRRPPELHYLYERPLETARAAGHEMPRVRELYEELKARAAGF
ncbi:MAG: 2-dehydropantoate 2-reductase [Planctomycetes bacterium]|nr:2-dehydropantoate 2-reductase [Planctomycetota bacterium]